MDFRPIDPKRMERDSHCREGRVWVPHKRKTDLEKTTGEICQGNGGIVSSAIEPFKTKRMEEI